MDPIVLRGATTHNLQGVDLDLAQGELTVFTGVSGSGKSSLAFDTLHAEAWRRYAEVFSPSFRALMEMRPRPPFERLEQLPPSLAVSQQLGGTGGPLATLGTLTDTASLLAILFARRSTQHCEVCDAVLHHTEPQAITTDLSGLPEGSRLLVLAPVLDHGERPAEGLLDVLATAGFARVRAEGRVCRIEEVRGSPRRLEVVVDRIRVGPDRRERIGEAVRLGLAAGGGRLVAAIGDEDRAYAERPWCGSCRAFRPVPSTRLLSHRSPVGACPGCQGRGATEDGRCTVCEGARLNPAARALRLGGRSLPELARAPCEALPAWLDVLPEDPGTEPAVEELRRRLAVLERVGLGYLSLDRSGASLSTGELRRARLASVVGSRLSGLLVVLDEPTAGLHPEDTGRLVQVLEALRDEGNTLVVVEHDPQVIAAADRVVDFGPGPGTDGGRVVFDGTAEALATADTVTGRWLGGREQVPPRPRRPLGPPVEVRGARGRTLQALDLDLPTRALVALTGPSGSGKSTLLLDTVVASLEERPDTLEVDRVQAPRPFRRIVRVDATPPGRTRHSTPATYTKLWDRVRKAYARTREARIQGWKAGRFTLSRKGGRCEACQGEGVRRIDLKWMAPVEVTCETCEGRRFDDLTLKVRLRGRDLSELLAMPVREARRHLAGLPKLDEPLRVLELVGLGYVPLGQPTRTLSGGEAHRLRLARELAAGAGGPEDALYVLDEPCTGLHAADVARLVGVRDALGREGGTVWVIEHDPLLIGAADHVVELGPGAGTAGGELVAQGRPEALAADAASSTGRWLR